MYTWFFASVIGLIATVKLHFLSVEHLKLQTRYGKEKGNKIGMIYGLISGWGFFFFWIGIWFSPQPRFTIPIFQNLTIFIPGISLAIPLFHLLICAPFFMSGAWVAIKGVKETTLKVAETHRTETIVTTGVYSIVRHPQYLGGLLAHTGISFLLSALYSLFSTPLVIIIVYLMSRKEEMELTREFGKEYENYRKKVPMLLPKLRGRQKEKTA
jgi:protein-S-isoprenylcysteine O-methyltransferase Ste14